VIVGGRAAAVRAKKRARDVQGLRMQRPEATDERITNALSGVPLHE
jgi:hypothetical protein